MQRLFTWRNAISGGVVALALWGVVATGWYVVYGGAAADSTDERKSVAVLPLTNMSANPDDQYFTDGIHDAIIEHLAKIGDLKVISRTSVMEYRNTTKNIRQIAEELGVATVLEGGVQRAGDLVKITAQLISAGTGGHLWAESYQRELTAQNVFAVQGDVAKEIAAALRATLTPAEKERVEQRPTENLEAYDYYLRGNDYFNRGWAEEDLRIAAQMYKKAIELDPSFSLAYARLSETHSQIYWYYYDRSDERLLKAREAIDNAFRLKPNLPEAHLALGYYHYRRRDYGPALEEFAIAQKSQPNSSSLFQGIGFVQRRQGKWEAGLRSLEKAAELDPRSAEITHLLGSTSFYMRKYAEAEGHLDRAISLQPDWPQPRLYKAWLYLSWEGNAKKARAVLEDAWKEISPAPLVTILDDVQPWQMLRSLSADSQEMLRRMTRSFFGPDIASYYLSKAEFHWLMNQREVQHAYYDSTRLILESGMESRLDEAHRHSLLGVAHAGLGREEEAIREATRAVELMPVSKDALWGGAFIANLAWVYAKLGEYDAAIDQLERLLSMPSIISVPLLRVDPIWDPLRSHPRFQALLEREQ